MAAARHGAGCDGSEDAGIGRKESRGTGGGEKWKAARDGEKRGEGGARATAERRDGTVVGSDSPESAEYDSLTFFHGLMYALHDTPSHQSLTFPPGRAGRERQLSGRVREVLFRHVVSPTAPASFAVVRARVVKRPERRSLWS